MITCTRKELTDLLNSGALDNKFATSDILTGTFPEEDSVIYAFKDEELDKDVLDVANNFRKLATEHDTTYYESDKAICLDKNGRLTIYSKEECPAYVKQTSEFDKVIGTMYPEHKSILEDMGYKEVAPWITNDNRSAFVFANEFGDEITVIFDDKFPPVVVDVVKGKLSGSPVESKSNEDTPTVDEYANPIENTAEAEVNQEAADEGVVEMSVKKLTDTEFFNKFDNRAKKIRNPEIELIGFKIPNGKICYTAYGGTAYIYDKDGKQVKKLEYSDPYEIYEREFSVDGDNKYFKSGKELAKEHPGYTTDEIKAAAPNAGVPEDEIQNFIFGYNSVDKKAPNIGSGESKIDEIRQKSSSNKLRTFSKKTTPLAIRSFSKKNKVASIRRFSKAAENWKYSQVKGLDLSEAESQLSAHGFENSGIKENDNTSVWCNKDKKIIITYEPTEDDKRIVVSVKTYNKSIEDMSDKKHLIYSRQF